MTCTRIIGIALFGLAAAVSSSWAMTSVGDSVYAAHHPSIMFTVDDLPALRARVTDGGPDDDAYDLIYTLAHGTYASWHPASLLAVDVGMQPIPNLGLVAWIEEPFDTVAMETGREATLYLAGNYAPDFDEANAGLRLRTLVLGYDLFFRDATPGERQIVLDEIVEYLTLMVWSLPYDLFAYRPYLANHSAMFAGPLGMAAVSLRGQVDDGLLDEALADADRICHNLIEHQIDIDGSYKEGTFYGLWTMKNLLFYFDARKRYDGYDYSGVDRIRNLERSFAFELLPEGYSHSNNINDANYTTIPYALNTSYFDWAMDKWDSGLSAWIWEHVAGTYGVNAGPSADNAAMILWHRPIAPVQPASILPDHMLWLDRGLYYYRTGWPSEMSSDDVLFSFYSGKFHGGHAQEDQNQFTLYGYGDRYAIDHGSGTLARESEAHNIVFVDGQGQHNAGNSVGTDGEITDYLLSEFADYLVGDATAAYSTYSEFNRNDHPIEGIDWSWGHKGANPVVYARRRVLAVHGPGDPFFLIADDIDKDGQLHEYTWRLHTKKSNTIDTTADPVVITGGSSQLQIHALRPSFSALTATVSPFDNQTTEPDSKLLSLATTATDPGFAFLLVPVPDPASPPPVTRQPYPWGEAVAIDRGSGHRDVLVFNPGRAAAAHGAMDTDAALAVARIKGGSVLGFLVLDATFLTYGSTDVVTCTNGPLTCAFGDGVVDLGRYDAAWRIADLGVTRVRYRSQELGFVVDGKHVVPDGVTAVGTRPPAARALEISAYPNPFNPSTTVRVRATGYVAIDVFDVAGHHVRALWRGNVDGTHHLTWDGRGDGGERAASGAYLIRVRSGARQQASKVILLK